MDALSLSASDLLKITTPEKLFSPDNLKLQLARLRKAWHPDLNKSPDATAVFNHITQLHQQAESALASNSWRGSSVVQWETDSSYIEFKYLRMKDFELGQEYISKSRILYLLKGKDNRSFFDNYRSRTKFEFASDRMKEQFLPVLPEVEKIASFGDIHGVLLKRHPNSVSLRDLLEYFGGKIEAKHVAWIMNRLYNMVCYFNHNQISHLALSLDSVYVNPELHTAHIYGGYWYSKKYGDTVKNVPAALLEYYPKSLRVTKQANPLIDAALLKVIGLQLLGDKFASGSILLRDKSIPQAMVRFLQLPVDDNPVKDFRAWNKVIDASLGPRKFVKLEVDTDKIDS